MPSVKLEIETIYDKNGAMGAIQDMRSLEQTYSSSTKKITSFIHNMNTELKEAFNQDYKKSLSNLTFNYEQQIRNLQESIKIFKSSRAELSKNSEEYQKLSEQITDYTNRIQHLKWELKDSSSLLKNSYDIEKAQLPLMSVPSFGTLKKTEGVALSPEEFLKNLKIMSKVDIEGFGQEKAIEYSKGFLTQLGAEFENGAFKGDFQKVVNDLFNQMEFILPQNKISELSNEFQNLGRVAQEDLKKNLSGIDVLPDEFTKKLKEIYNSIDIAGVDSKEIAEKYAKQWLAQLGDTMSSGTFKGDFNKLFKDLNENIEIISPELSQNLKEDVEKLKSTFVQSFNSQFDEETLSSNKLLGNLKKILSLNLEGYDNKKEATDYVKRVLSNVSDAIKTSPYKDKIKESFKDISNKIFEISPDIAENVKEQTDEIVKSFSNFEKNSFLKTFKNQFITVGARALGVNLAIKAFEKLTVFIRESIQLYAEAEQKFTKFSTTFSGWSSSLNDVYKLASKIGLAASTTANAVATIGEQLQAQGALVGESATLAMDWSEKLQDIIRFKDLNVSLDEFAQSFMAGAMGNTRNFRSFGSIVRENTVQMELAKKGLVGLTGEALEYEKMLIRANIAFEQQKNAMGATGREWDTFLAKQERHTEAVKAYKEEVGGFWAGIKEIWYDLTTDMLNDRTKSSVNTRNFEKWDGKSEFASLYDLTNNRDFTAFENKINTVFMNLADLSDNEDSISKQLYEIAVMFGASADDLKKVIGDEAVLQGPLNQAIKLLDNYKEVIVSQSKNIEKGRQDFMRYYDKYLKNEDTLSSINGVNISNFSIPDIEDYENNIKQTIAYNRGKISEENIKNILSSEIIQFENTLIAAGKEALNSVLNTQASDYGKELEEKIGDYKQVDLLSDRRNSLKSLYNALNNIFISAGKINWKDDKISPQEQILLDIVEAIKGIDINIEKEKEKEKETDNFDVNSQLKKILNGTADTFGRQFDLIAGDYFEIDLLQDKMSALVRLYDEYTAYALKDNEISDDEQAIRENIINEYKKLYENLKERNKEEEEFNSENMLLNENFEKQNTIQKNWDDKLKAYNAIGRSQWDNSIYGDRIRVNKEIDEIKRTFKDVGYYTLGKKVYNLNNDKEIDELKDVLEDIVRAAKDWSTLTKVAQNVFPVKKFDEFDFNNMGQLGMNTINAFMQTVMGAFDMTAIGDLYKAIAQGFEQGGIFGALVNAVLSILDRLDGWDIFMELGEKFVQMFANMFQPLMPMLIMMAETVNSLFAPIFKLLFPIIKFIAQAVVVIEGIIGEIFGVVLDIVDWLTGSHSVNPIRLALNATADDLGIEHGIDSFDTALKLVEGIGNMSYQIAQNTNPEDNNEKLKAYQDMYNAGLITLEELTGLWNNLRGVQTDLVKTYDFGSYRTVGNQTTVYQDDVKIIIEGSNLSAEQIAIKVAQYWKNQRRAGNNTTWAVTA